MRIKILYEDKDILAIDKPSGISVHSDGRTKEKTIADWVLKKYPKTKNVGEPIYTKVSSSSEDEGKTFVIYRPGIVHRLDKDTSGVLIIVKNKKAFAYFKKQFMDREIKKVYNAIVLGWAKNDHDTIRKPIGRSPSDFRKKLAGRGARGELREAVTEYSVLKRFEDRGNRFTYLEVRPKTGRTHQIRVHMKFINHPVSGDPLYNPGKPHPKGLDRLALHAKSIEFNLPAQTGDLKGKTIKVESPLPPEFKKVLK